MLSTSCLLFASRVGKVVRCAFESETGRARPERLKGGEEYNQRKK